MLLSRTGSGNGDGDGDSNNAQLLRDIEAISKALYLQNAPNRALISRPSGRSKSVERPRLSEPQSNLNHRNFSASVLSKDKKSNSVWNWKKPLKAITHIGHQKFDICFFLHVHSIEGLPPGFNDMDLSVHWKRKDEVLQTRTARVVKGFAEFDETLMHECCVYGNRSGPHGSAKYEVKLFLIYASIIGALGVDMGKHWIDLTRLLPVTLEELEGLKSTGKWTTGFKLAGKAKGATLNVSFGFSLVMDDLIKTRRNINISELVNLVDSRSCTAEKITNFGLTNNNGMFRRVGSVSSDLNVGSHIPSQSVNVKSYGEVSPNLGLELSKSIKFLYQKLNEVNLHNSEELHTLYEHMQPLKSKPSPEFEYSNDISRYEYDSIEFTVIEQGMEMLEKENVESEECDDHPVDDSGIETIDVDEIFKDADIELDEKTTLYSGDNIFDNYVDVLLGNDSKHEERPACRKESCTEDLELTFNNLLTLGSAELESSHTTCEFLEQENCMETISNYKDDKVLKKSRSLDELSESVATDFLNMLGIEHSAFGLSSDGDLESPRGRLLREFEEEAMSSGSFIIEYDGDRKHQELGCVDLAESDCGNLSRNFGFSIATRAIEEDCQMASKLLSRRRKARALEDLETEALMRDWGLNEEAFNGTPRHCSDGFGSPVELPPAEPIELPPLEDGLGSLVQTEGGGYLRSMNPSLFRNSKNVGALIMQVSHSIVLPAELGRDIIEILQHLTSIGIERLSLAVNRLMPLEDITGKTLQQVAQDAALGAAAPVRETSLCCESLFEQDTALDADAELDYVTVENLVPLAMDKIETMSIEGLKIQSGMSEEAPLSFGPKNIGKTQVFEGKRANLGWFLRPEGSAELQELGAQDSGSDVDRLLDLSITLDEWLKLDAGVIGHEDKVSEHTVNTLVAHHAKCVDFINGGWRRVNNPDRAFGRRHGLLGNNLIVAFMVLLRDPFRNYEPVGSSMLALVQVERCFLRCKPTIYSTLLERSETEMKDNECVHKEDTNSDVTEEDRCSIRFKITEFHLSGLNTDHWGTKTQQQYGTRWLLASGMSTSSKHSFSKSQAIVLSHPHLRRRKQTDDVLWSISSHANGPARNWKDLAVLFPHVRNPNVIFPK